MMRSVEEALEHEQRDFEAYRTALAALVAVSAPIARLGDGNCGCIFRELEDRLREVGLYRDPPKKVSKKVTLTQALRTRVFERDK